MPAITSANAAELGRQGAQARKQRRIAELERLARAKIIEEGAIAAAAVNALNPATAQAPAPLNDNYVKDRLARVRKQLDRIDAMMLDEEDPTKLDRLAAASARLAAQEGYLADRPGPGTKRPRAPKSTGSSASDPEPEPA